MDISKWLQFRVFHFLVYLLSYIGQTTGFTRTISLFHYCGARFPISALERYDIQIYGSTFPGGKRTCHVKFYAHDSADVLLYKVTKASIHTLSEEISVDSSRDGETFQSQEFITQTSPPRYLNKELEGERYMNVSAYRVSGHMVSSFKVNIQIYGEEFYQNDGDVPHSSLSGSDILGVVLGIGFAVFVFLFVAFYMRKTRCDQRLTSRQRDQGTTTSRAAPTGQNADIAMRQCVLGDQHLGPLPFLPPYSPEPSSDSIFTVQSHCSSDPPPSYEEVMKTGLREVSL